MVFHSQVFYFPFSVNSLSLVVNDTEHTSSDITRNYITHDTQPVFCFNKTWEYIENTFTEQFKTIPNMQ